ncbi:MULTISPECIES: hypothetical protein [unclassified Micromonospora]|uniref:hypothetical protein n=1 Tax=unclassified Micromonospora TaxID=2617518 RepID=UPI003318C69B
MWIGRLEAQTVVALRPMIVPGSRNGEPSKPGGPFRKVIPADTKLATGRGTAMAALLLLAITGAFVSCLGGAAWPVWIGLLVLAIVCLVMLGTSTSSGVTLKRLERFPDEHVILHDRHGRARFNMIEDLGRRIDRNTPLLQRIIPREDANYTLVHALWEGARLVAWHQNVRAAIVELSRQNTTRLPPGSVELRQQSAERERTMALRGEIESQLDELRTRLEALADAGDEFIREQKNRQVTRRAQERLADAGTSANGGRLGMADELANHTLALLQAYEELTEAYANTGDDLPVTATAAEFTKPFDPGSSERL